jgi:hypothetical protein
MKTRPPKKAQAPLPQTQSTSSPAEQLGSPGYIASGHSSTRRRLKSLGVWAMGGQPLRPGSGVKSRVHGDTLGRRGSVPGLAPSPEPPEPSMEGSGEGRGAHASRKPQLASGRPPEGAAASLSAAAGQDIDFGASWVGLELGSGAGVAEYHRPAAKPPPAGAAPAMPIPRASAARQHAGTLPGLAPAWDSQGGIGLPGWASRGRDWPSGLGRQAAGEDVLPEASLRLMRE